MTRRPRDVDLDIIVSQTDGRAGRPIRLVVPGSDIDPGEEPVETLFIHPDGATPGREVPGFFIIQIDGKPVWPGDGHAPSDAAKAPALPRQFLSLDAVHAYLQDQYGWTVPLRITNYAATRRGGPREFPVIWGAERRIGKRRAQIRARYLGSFCYWDGRPVDPAKVGTTREFN